MMSQNHVSCYSYGKSGDNMIRFINMISEILWDLTILGKNGKIHPTSHGSTAVCNISAESDTTPELQRQYQQGHTQEHMTLPCMHHLKW